MAQVFHGDVGTIVPTSATYEFPDQSMKVERQVIKLVADKYADYGPEKRIKMTFPADGYINGQQSYLAFRLAITHPTKLNYLAVLNVRTNVVTGDKEFELEPLADIVTIPNIQSEAGVTANALRTQVNAFSNYLVVWGDDSGYRQTSLVQSQDNSGLLTFQNPPQLANGTYQIKLWNGGRLQKYGTCNLFSRLETRYGGNLLGEDQKYNLKTRMLYAAGVSRPWEDSSGAILEGCYSSLDDEGNEVFGVRGPGTRSAENVAAGLFLNRRRFTHKLVDDWWGNKKVLPAKFMAPQLEFELTTAAANECLLGQFPGMTYVMTDVEYITEFHNYGEMYDSGFIDGLQTTGIPYKFSAWHYHSSAVSGKQHWFHISDKSRSVKTVIAVVRDENLSVLQDAFLFYHNAGNYVDPAGAYISGTNSKIESYQWRLGQKYHPAQPVDCTEGAVEAYVELQKTINALGDYTFSTSITPRDWSSDIDALRGHSFMMILEAENSDVYPNTIAGMNAEEMNDLMLKVIFDSSITAGRKRIDILLQYDKMAILRPSNKLDVIE